MIDVTVNLPNGETVEVRSLSVGVIEAFNAAKIMYPDWTSIMIVVINTRKED